MKNFSQHYKTALILLGGPLFTYFFLNKTMGINAVLFTVWILGLLTLSRQGLFRHRSVQLLMTSAIIIAFNCFWHTSINALIALISNLIVLSGIAYKYKIKFIISGLLNGLFNLLLFLKNWFHSRKKSSRVNTSSRSLTKLFKLAVAPITAIVIFFILFVQGNLILSSIGNWILNQFNLFLLDFSSYISASSIFLMITGTCITAWVLYSRIPNQIQTFDQKYHINLFRKKQPRKFKILGLLNEYKSGLILLISINVLLALVNGIDIYYVWFNQIPNDWNASDYSQYVHEGTFSLITSVLLSMGIMMYYFRGNQNFFNKFSVLRTWALIWIAQNTLLVLSLVIRNWSYVEQFDLAYKRIGVFLFLLATLVGLFSIAVKIQKKRTFYYLIQTNGWTWLILVFLMSFVNWDRLIVSYNLEHAGTSAPDMKFILERSDKTLDIIAKHPQFLTTMPQYNLGYDHINDQYLSPKQAYMIRKQAFIDRNRNQHWLSTNIIENRVFKNLNP